MEDDISIETLCDNAGFLKEDIDYLADTTQTSLDTLGEREVESAARIKEIMNELRTDIDNKERSLLSLNESEFLKCRGELQSRLTKLSDLGRAVEALPASFEKTRSQEDHGNTTNMKHCFESLESMYLELNDRKICPEFVVNQEERQAWENLQYGKFEYNTKFTEPAISAQTEAGGFEPPPYSEILETMEFDFACQTKYETVNPYLTALIWVNRKLVIADKANHKIKFFWEVGDFLHEIAFMGSEPYGVCYIPQDNGTREQYAVTLPKQKKIYFIFQNGTEPPVVKYDIGTALGYGGITCLGKVGLAVTAVGIDFPRVDIIGYYGATLRSMAADSLQKPLFSYPRYIVADGKVCIVSDWRQNKLTFLDHTKCSILGSYTGTSEHPLQNPYGVTVDGKGYIFVVDGKTGKIHVVDRSFQLVRLIEDSGGLISTRLLAFDSHTGRLAVTYAGGCIKSLLAPSAAPDYNHASGREVPSAPEKPDMVRLVPESDPNLKCPSPGF